MQNKNIRSRISLLQFVEKRKEILSILGIFAALAIFSQSFMSNVIGVFVSFMFLSCLCLLYLELLFSFEKEDEATENLHWFQLFLFLAGVGIISFWLVRLWQYDEKFFYKALTLASTLVLMNAVGRIFRERGIYDTRIWRVLNTSELKLLILFWGPIYLLFAFGINITLTSFAPKIVDPIFKDLNQKTFSFNANYQTPPKGGVCG